MKLEQPTPDWEAAQTEAIHSMVDILMRWDNMTAYEKLADLFYQTYPPGIVTYVYITRVNKSSINYNTTSWLKSD